MKKKNFIRFVAFVAALASVFFSCNETKDKSSSSEGSKEESENNRSSLQNPIIENPKSGSIPAVIKSVPPQGYYGYERDDAQISQYIRRIFQDSKGNLWFGTTDDGAIRYNKKSLTYFTNRDGLAGNGVFGILEDKNGNIWFATNGGVSKYDSKNFTNYTTKQGLSDNGILCILEDKNGKIWVGTGNGTCYLEGDEFIPFPLPVSPVEVRTDRLNPKTIWSILEDKNGNIWFGTDGYGVCKYDPLADFKKGGKKFTYFTMKDGLCNDKVVGILEDKKGNIWFSSIWSLGEGGISRYDGTNIKSYTKKDGISGDKGVWSMFEDKNGMLWLAARGVDKLDPESDSFTNLNEEDGLTNISVQSIFEDNDGNFWIGTGAGLFRYDGNKISNQKVNEPW